jgi:hypothetical protein
MAGGLLRELLVVAGEAYLEVARAVLLEREGVRRALVRAAVALADGRLGVAVYGWQAYVRIITA